VAVVAQHYSKQLLALAGEQTMLQQTAMRLDGLPGVESPVLASKPDGTPRKLLDIGRMSQLGVNQPVRYPWDVFPPVWCGFTQR
jgi:hypothetical protein